jgi:cupin fold WbuC family metalloprotein
MLTPTTEPKTPAAETEIVASGLREAKINAIDGRRLQALAAEARASARGRSHLLLHQDASDPIQRFLVAGTRGTYIRPHRHPKQWELVALLSGVARVLTFTPHGRMDEYIELGRSGACVVEIPQNAWHTIVILAPDTLFMEVKPGPCQSAEFAPWAPEEGAESCGEYVRGMESG